MSVLPETRDYGGIISKEIGIFADADIHTK